MRSTAVRAAVAAALSAALTAALTAVAGPPATAAGPAAGGIERVSTSSQGGQLADSSTHAVMSADGRYAAFYSGDASWDEYELHLKDLTTGALTRIPNSFRWGPDAPSISADGRYAGFTTGVSSGAHVYDRTTGVSTLLTPPDGKSYKEGRFEALGSDGRFLAYAVSGPDPKQHRLRDQVTGADEPLTAKPVPGRSNGMLYGVGISTDGANVAYGFNYFGTGPDGRDIYVKNRRTGAHQQVDVTHDGKPANADARFVRITDDGRSVIFNSEATNIVATQVPAGMQAYRRDLATNRTVHLGPGVDAVSGDGRYAVTMENYVQYHRDLVEGHRTELGDYRDYGLTPGAIGAGGKSVVFASYKAMVADDTNNQSDVFVRRIE